MQTFIALPVWGAKYTRIFLDWALPSLLAPGNLINHSFAPNSVVFIYTTAASRLVLEADPGIQRLKKQLEVQWNVFEEPETEPHRFYKHQLLSACYADAAVLAQENGAALMPLTADNLYTAGAFSLLLEQGHKSDLVMIAGLRLNASATEGDLLSLRRATAISLSRQKLLQLILKYPHPHFLASFFDAEEFTVWPSHVYNWQTPTVFRAQCFHLHPVWIRHPRPFGPGPQGSNPHLNNLDGHYLQQYFEAGARFQIMADSECLGVTLSDLEDVPMKSKPLSISERQATIEAFGQNYCLPVHRYFYKTPIIFRL
jgi:hypothetical protein